MKRFYCKVCKRVKRVRVIPSNVTTPQAEKVTDRIGRCNYHNSIGLNRRESKELVGVK